MSQKLREKRLSLIQVFRYFCIPALFESRGLNILQPVVENGRICPAGDIWQSLQALLVVMPWEGKLTLSSGQNTCNLNYLGD